MANPFEDEVSSYVVLKNQEGQYSLWPSGYNLPLGWTEVLPASSRQACLDYVNRTWTDMRPKSLRDRDSDAKSV